MAERRTSESDREAMLRRVAIVLSSLPAPTAAQLLGSIDAQTKQAVRRTMTSLSDVDPLERRRALRAFKVSVEKLPDSKTPAGKTAENQIPTEDEVAISASAEPSHAGSRVVSSAVSVDRTAEESSPLSFLGDVQDDTLVSLLAIEHPQAVALVLASIAPVQAARVLPRLDPKIQTDALARIGRLGNIPETAVTEIAEHFQARLVKNTGDGRNATGQRALGAILAAMPTPPVATSVPPVANSMPPHAGIELHAGIDSVASQTSAPAPQDSPQPSIAASAFPSADVPAIDLAHKLRAAEQELPELEPAANRELQSAAEQRATSPPGDPVQGADDDVPESASDDEHSTASEGRSVFESTDAINQHLLHLPPAHLCQALGKVGTRDALLALCGLPNRVAESVLAILPRAHAKQVRMQMATLNTLHLREIDLAKEKVAVASSQTSDQSLQQVPVAA